MASLANPYFVKDSATEQNLLNSLVTESIQVSGRTYYYLPRYIQKEDLVLGEDVLSKFILAIPIEMYMTTNMGFEGQKEMYSKFGLQIQNSFTLVVSQTRWEQEVKVMFDNNPNNGEAVFDLKTMLRPNEGDLVFDPLTTGLYEIKFVDHDVEFFSIGKNYMYHLSCEAFQYSNETISTGVPAIDAFDRSLNNNLVADQLLNDTGGAVLADACDPLLITEEDPPSDIDREYGTDFEEVVVDNNVDFKITNPFGE